MVKYSPTLVIAALIAAPTLAQSNWDEFDAREYDDLFTRHPDSAGLTTREWQEPSLDARSYNHGDDLHARELDELYERALERLEDTGRTTMPSFFNFMRDGMRAVKKVAHEPHPAKKDGKNMSASPTTPTSPSTPTASGSEEEGEDSATEAAADLVAREYEENAFWERALDETLQEREFFDEGLQERDLYENEMQERDYDDYPQEREFFDDTDVYERGLYDDADGLYVREDGPSMFELLRRAYLEDLD